MTSPSSGKITRRHLERKAYVYVRQSTMHQVLHHTESQQRQYELVQRAKSLGWPSHQITVIDQDLGQSGADRAREGFQRLVAEVGLGHVGIILGLEVSRLARNNADWYQLLDLCAICSTLIADSDGIYDPANYNDRLLLGLKGTMSEAELHLIRNRMQGGLIHKAQKGQLRTWLPAGYEYDGEGCVIEHSNEAIVTVIDMVFRQFRALGSARMVMTWLHAEDIATPVAYPGKGIVWQKPSYRTVHRLLTNPIYAGAYVYGRVRYEKVIGPDGKVQVKGKKLAREQWPILIQDHHEGYITWEEYLENQERLTNNFKGPKGHPRTEPHSYRDCWYAEDAGDACRSVTAEPKGTYCATVANAKRGTDLPKLGR